VQGLGCALILDSSVNVFCFNDFSLFGLFVEGGIWQRFLVVKQGKVATGVLANSHLGITHGIGWAFGLDLVNDFLEL